MIRNNVYIVHNIPIMKKKGGYPKMHAAHNVRNKSYIYIIYTYSRILYSNTATVIRNLTSCCYFRDGNIYIYYDVLVNECVLYLKNLKKIVVLYQ